MNDGAALIRYVLMWGVPFAIVVAALGYETDWGHDVDHEAPVRVAAAPQPVAVSLLPEYRIGRGGEARKETGDGGVKRARLGLIRQAALLFRTGP